MSQINAAPTQRDLSLVDHPNGEKVATWGKAWSSWFTQAFQILFAVQQSGLTTQRPTGASQLWIGRPYFDTDLGTPIWWDGAQWIDASGAPV